MILYHLLSLCLSHLSCKTARPIICQTAALAILREHPRTHLAPPNMMLSRGLPETNYPPTLYYHTQELDEEMKEATFDMQSS